MDVLKALETIRTPFFNDLFSLVGVLIFIVINGKTSALSLPANVGNIFIYSAVIGVLPNLLLFYGLRSSNVVAASMVIMLEPIMSGVLAFLIHDDTLGFNFMLGAVCILISNLPQETMFYLRKVRVSYAIPSFK